MKLPFNNVLAPLIKPHLKYIQTFCQYPTFYISLPYTYFYGALGFSISILHLKRHFGDVLLEGSDRELETIRNPIILHDIQIIGASMGILQYFCLLVGCFTKNPALFLPHLIVHPVFVLFKTVNAFLILTKINLTSISMFREKTTAIVLMMFNWCQEFCVFRRSCEEKFVKLYDQVIAFGNTMENESCSLLEELKFQNAAAEELKDQCNESPDNVRTRLRALMVALFGVSMSVCAIASQPVELELDDNEVAKKLNNVTFARRITKPTIRLVIGYGTISATVTTISSLLLLLAVMSKKSWWQRGARWLAAPALLVAALETASDLSDFLLLTILRSSEAPAKIAAQTLAACALITVEILVWYFIAKFFEHNPSTVKEDEEKSTL